MDRRQRKLLNKGKPRRGSSKRLGSVIAVLWSIVGLVALALLLVGLFLYLPGSNSI